MKDKMHSKQRKKMHGDSSPGRMNNSKSAEERAGEQRILRAAEGRKK